MRCRRGSRDCTFPVLDRTSSSDISASEGSKSSKSPESMEEDWEPETEVTGSSKVKEVIRLPAASIHDLPITDLRDEMEFSELQLLDFVALPRIPEYSMYSSLYCVSPIRTDKCFAN